MLETQQHEQGPCAAACLTPEHLHARYAPRIARHVRAVLGRDDELEDVVHEVLMAVFRGIGRLRDPACLDGWVTQVTANKLNELLRRRRVRRHDSWEILSEPEIPAFQADLEARFLAWRAVRVIDRLPASDRALLAAFWFSPATLDSVAADAGCAAVTMRRRLYRARNRFERLARRDPALARCLDRTRVEATPASLDE